MEGSALGASSRELMAIILTRGAALTGGLTLGLAAAIATGQGLAPLLYGVPPSHPPTFALVVMLVGIGAMVASYLPARRAAHVDPIVHLRAKMSVGARENWASPRRIGSFSWSLRCPGFGQMPSDRSVMKTGFANVLRLRGAHGNPA